MFEHNRFLTQTSTHNELLTGIGGRLRERRLPGVGLQPGALGNRTVARIC